MKKLNITFKSLFLFVWNSKPILIIYLLISAVLNTINALVIIYLPKFILDIVTDNLILREIIKPFVLLFLLLLSIKFANDHINKIIEVHKVMFKEEALIKFNQKINRIDYEHLENPDILDLKESAIYAVSVFDALNTFFTALNATSIAIFICLGMSVILLRFNIIYFLFVLLISTISLMLSKKSLEEGQKTTKELIPLNRRYGYYDSLSMNLNAQKDIRVNQATPMLLDKLRDFNKGISNWLNALYTRQSNIKSIQIILALFLKVTSYVYLASTMIKSDHTINLGNFFIYIGATESFSSSFIEVARHALRINQSSNYLEPFFKFMNIAESDIKYGEKVLQCFDTLEFKDVHFTYPGTNKEVLESISFKINKGDKISLVGLNGSGKSTIVKLLFRFFTPNKGVILINGIPIEEYEYSSYHELLSAIFQDFAIFSYSIRDNINLTDESIDDNYIINTLEQVGLYSHIKKLPKGINTYLNNSIYENSTQFSGGQNQRLAIARALLKDYDFIVLDEPTAQLDPLAENEIMNMFFNLVNKKTAIFISHRMSTCVISDKVIVLENGTVTGFDNHHKLINYHGFYRNLFEAQSSYYVNHQPT